MPYGSCKVLRFNHKNGIIIEMLSQNPQTLSKCMCTYIAFSQRSFSLCVCNIVFTCSGIRWLFMSRAFGVDHVSICFFFHPATPTHWLGANCDAQYRVHISALNYTHVFSFKMIHRNSTALRVTLEQIKRLKFQFASQSEMLINYFVCLNVFFSTPLSHFPGLAGWH